LILGRQGGFLISQIKQIGGRIFEKILTEKGIDAFNGAQGRILYVLWQNESISITELSEKTGLAKTTLTSMLDRLEVLGLIQRVFDKTDRRKILINLSEEARELQNEYDEVSAKMNEIYYQGFSDGEISQFEGYLLRILENLNGGNNNG
jgi:MarR family transcriptional regulator, organic hydroperoxide resistance regulator